MSDARMFSLGNAIRLMILLGLVTVFVVIVQSCQKPKNALSDYKTGVLSKLWVLENPPAQPTTIFATIDEETMQLSDYHGKVVLLNVWATWCPPCVAEMPMLDQLQSEMAGDDFEVVTISLDRHPQEPKDFFKEHLITGLTPWHGSIGVATSLRAPGLPVSIFYTRQGREVARITGEVDWTQPEVKNMINYLKDQ